MRGSVLSIICLLAAGPAAAQSTAGRSAAGQVKAGQPGATRTVDDYLCAFAGKCGDADDGAQPTRQAPETKGFRLARPTAERASAPARTAVALPTTGRSRRAAAMPAPTRVAATRSASRGGFASRSRHAAAAATAASLVSERRADLRLSFELGSDRLTAQAMEEARVFAQSLTRPELAGKRFLIEGHTDAAGGRAYNLDLSRRRARAVADQLTGLGVARDRLDVRGFGFDRPVAGQRAASPLNRRVEAVLVS